MPNELTLWKKHIKESTKSRSIQLSPKTFGMAWTTIISQFNRKYMEISKSKCITMYL